MRRIRPDRAFAAPEDLCLELAKIGQLIEISAGEIIFCIGQHNNGIFLVKKGRVALSAGEDPTRVTRIAQIGSLLGLPATVSAHTYSLTAEAVADTTLVYVSAIKFRRFLRENTTLCYSVLRMLAEEITAVRSAAVYRI